MPALPSPPPSRSATRQPSDVERRLRVQAGHLAGEALGLGDVVGVHAREQSPRGRGARPRSAPRPARRRRGTTRRRRSPARGSASSGRAPVARAVVDREAPRSRRRSGRAANPGRRAAWTPRPAPAGGRRRGAGGQPCLEHERARLAHRALRRRALHHEERTGHPGPPFAARGAPDLRLPRGLVAHRARGSRTPSRRGAAWSGCRGWRRVAVRGRATAPSPRPPAGARRGSPAA